MFIQSAEPKIHIVHNKCTKLITDIALRFIDKCNSKGILLNTDELPKVIKYKENHKVSFKFLWLISETWRLWSHEKNDSFKKKFCYLYNNRLIDIKIVSLNKRKRVPLLTYLTILVAFPRPLSLLMLLNLAIY